MHDMLGSVVRRERRSGRHRIRLHADGVVMTEFLFCLSIPTVQLAALVLLGWLFRVDKPKGGK